MTIIKNRGTLRRKKPDLVCELVKHSEGAFEINGQMYIPTWPRGATGVPNELIEGTIALGVQEARAIYDGTEKTPDIIRVERYQSGKIIILQRDSPQK